MQCVKAFSSAMKCSLLQKEASRAFMRSLLEPLVPSPHVMNSCLIWSLAFKKFKSCAVMRKKKKKSNFCYAVWYLQWIIYYFFHSSWLSVCCCSLLVLHFAKLVLYSDLTVFSHRSRLLIYTCKKFLFSFLAGSL